MKVLVIIPAKLDSTRLKKKNLRELNGKSLVEHSIDYAKASKHEVEIIVSSESDEVREVSLKNNVIFRSRGIELCGDAEVVDVYLDIVANINATFDLVVGLQPDNPNRSHTLDECIDYMLKNDYDDLITVNFKSDIRPDIKKLSAPYELCEKSSACQEALSLPLCH